MQAHSMIDVLRRRALTQPDREAYVFLQDGLGSELKLSYAELDQKARAIGALLQSLDAKGKRALLLYPQGLDYIAAFLGCLYAGVVAVPIYPPRQNHSLARIQTIFVDAEATVALGVGNVIRRIEPLFAQAPELAAMRWIETDKIDMSLAEEWVDPKINGDMLAFLQYTSGSTAAPKGVMVSHSNLLHNEEMIRQAFQQDEHSVVVGWLPLYHDMGLIGNILQPLYTGARCVLLSPVSFLQKPLRWLQAISHYKATTSGGPNFAYDLCVRKITIDQQTQLDLKSWRVAFNGSEPVRSETIDRFAEAFKATGFRREAFYPCYGLAEATLLVSGGLKSESLSTIEVQMKDLEKQKVSELHLNEKDSRVLVGCGGIQPDQMVVIANPVSLVKCLPDEVGEIWVKGPNIAQGYWNRPEETVQTFRAYLLDDENEGPFLRTGDLGFLKNGELYITGRLKDLIIIRGRNLYPQDLERSIEGSHPEMRQDSNAAFAVEVNGEERLVIVQEINHRIHLDPDEIIERIRQTLIEEYDVRAYALVLVKPGMVSKTSSGKIQRYACRNHFLNSTLDVIREWRDCIESVVVEEKFTESELQEILPSFNTIVAWLQERLAAQIRTEARFINITEPLARYGIDSLMAADISHEIENIFGIVSSPVELLDGSSINKIASQLMHKLTLLSTDIALVRTERNDTDHSLSHGQRALWFVSRMAPDSAILNLAGAIRIRSDLNVEALQHSFQVLTDRHALLRTTFHEVEGESLQRVSDGVDVSFTNIDASSWTESAFNESVITHTNQPFDLSQGPLLRVMLYTIADDEYVLLVMTHHIVADYWSLSVLLRELGIIYYAEKSQSKYHLPFLSLQYKDYVSWQSDLLAGAEGERLYGYWSEKLAGRLSALDLPTDYPRPAVMTHSCSSVPLRLSPELTNQLYQMSRANGMTLYMSLLAAFYVLLFKHTGQHDLLIGTPTAGRSRAGFRNLIGYLVNPVVLRVNLSGNSSITSFLDQIRQTALEAIEHQNYPFALLVERIQPQRDANRSPIFQTMFNMLATENSEEQKGLASLALNESGVTFKVGEIVFESIALKQRAIQFDLTLTMALVGNGLDAIFEYNTSLFDQSTIARMSDHYINILESLIVNADQYISNLVLLSEAERLQLLVEWNNTGKVNRSINGIQELFEAQVKRTPDSVALIVVDQELTYRELNSRANQLAHLIRMLGVSSEVLVGVFMERSVEMVIVLLAILKAGGAYLPLDPEYPVDRIAFILEDAQVLLLLTTESMRERLPVCDTRRLCLDTEREIIQRYSESDPHNHTEPDHLAYVIYTSGSTGKPKGVAIEHHSVVTLIEWTNTIFSPSELSGVLATTTICFDVSVFELFAPLACGGTIIMVDNFLQLPTTPAANLITLIQTVPSLASELISRGHWPKSLRTAILVGEQLQSQLVQRIYEESEVEQVYNCYGPTEDTVYSTWSQVERGKHEQPVIGRPITGTQVYILDDQLQPVPIGVCGNIFLGGEGIARGYIKRPEFTAERFIPNPFNSKYGSRLYMTGDVGRYRRNGEIEYRGRVDQQVKLHGLRIELGEIEETLRQHKDIREAVVIVREDVIGDKRLVAYIVSKQRKILNTRKLRSYLAEHLPAYMIPSALVILDQLPLTPNGKANRRELPPPEIRQIDEIIIPITPTEKIIADCFAKVLNLQHVSIHDNFFELGGHSLLASRVTSHIQTAFEIEISLRNIFEYPTVACLAMVIDQQQIEQIDDEQLTLLLMELDELSEVEAESELQRSEEIANGWKL